MNIKSLEGPLQDRIELEENELACVKRALKTKLWLKTESKEDRLPKFQRLYTELAKEFAIDAPELQLSGSDDAGYEYDADSNTVSIHKLSLTTALTAFYHSVLNQREGDGGTQNSAFGLSAFKQAAPGLFESARTSGRLYEQPDFPYTDGGRIQPSEDEGDCDGDGDDDPETPPPPQGSGDQADRGNGPGED